MIQFIKHNAPNKQLILIILLVSCFSGLGQAPGYLGRRTSLSFGIGEPVIFRHRLDETARKNNSGAFPELTLAMEHSISYSISCYLRMSFYTMPDYLYTEEFTSIITHQCPLHWEGIHEMEKQTVTTIYLRPRIVYLNAGCRFYGEVSPMGRYWSLGLLFGKNIATSYITDSTTINDNKHTLPAIDQYLEKHPPVNYYRNVYGLSIGLGRQRMFSDRVMLDYGWRINWHINIEEPLLIFSDFTYPDITQRAYHHLQKVKLLELYLNIGLLI